MREGDHIRVIADGVVIKVEQAFDRPCCKIQFDERPAITADVWFYTDQVHLKSSKLARDAWREIVGDMIREGRDADAVAMLVEHSPDVVPYIKALENVVAKLGKICTHEVLWEQMQRLPETARPTFTKEQAIAIDVAYAVVASKRG